MFTALLIAACVAFAAGAASLRGQTAKTKAAAQEKQERVEPGKYVCYDLTLVLGAGGYRYGYKYMEAFTITADGRYRRDASGSQGRYRYDRVAKAVTFLDGPYAEAGRTGKYEPLGKSAASRLKTEVSSEKETGTPNIILHKKDDASGDLDWYCSLEK